MLVRPPLPPQCKLLRDLVVGTRSVGSTDEVRRDVEEVRVVCSDRYVAVKVEEGVRSSASETRYQRGGEV